MFHSWLTLCNLENLWLICLKRTNVDLNTGLSSGRLNSPGLLWFSAWSYVEWAQTRPIPEKPPSCWVVLDWSDSWQSFYSLISFRLVQFMTAWASPLVVSDWSDSWQPTTIGWVVPVWSDSWQLICWILDGFRMKQTKMYVCTLVEFILVEIWIHCCTKSKWLTLEECWFIYTRNKGLRNVRIALRSQLTSED